MTYFFKEVKAVMYAVKYSKFRKNMKSCVDVVTEDFETIIVN